jgi:uncharacterized repeat protein (TIGR02543 family)
MESQTCAAQDCTVPPDNTLVLAADDPVTLPDEGRSFAFVSGLGGKSIRDQENDGPWFASIYTSTQGADYGALFGVFNYQGDPRLAYFYFKDISGVIADEFFVRSMNGVLNPTIVIGDASVVEGDVGSTDAVFDVTLLSATGNEVRVDYATADGSATAGDDYEPVSGQLVFSGAVTVQTIRVPVNGDDFEEGDEIFFLDLSEAVGAELGDSFATGTILEDDAPLQQFTLTLQVDGQGTVTLTPPGEVYDASTPVELQALPDAGHVFVGWSGDLQGALNPDTIVMDGDKSITASFDLQAACNNDGSCGAGEDCGNCPNDCRQKARGNRNSRYCCDGDLLECGHSRCSESGWSCGAGGVCSSDPECDDAQFCNGVETCSGTSCQGGNDPCPGQSCDENSDQCVSCAINKSTCTSNQDCCSNRCKNGRCRASTR